MSLDVALFYSRDCNGTRRIFYCNEEKEVTNFLAPRKEKFSEKFMAVGALSGRGPLPFMKVPQKVKINSAYYVEHVLKPLLEVHVLPLYGEDTCQVFVHHDAASSHTARFMMDYAEDLKRRTGITIIKKSRIPVKSPDASPMDFYGFGFLKQQLFKRKAKTLEGVWKVLNDEWNKVSLITIRKVMESWKKRCHEISSGNGEHVEQTKAIHTHKSKL